MRRCLPDPAFKACVLTLLLAGLAAPAFHAALWKPIEPAELALASPRIDKAADAEILLWDVRVTHHVVFGRNRSTYEQYLRVKIFTDRGRESFARLDIPRPTHVEIFDVAARTVTPDGTATELKRSDFHEREIVNDEGVKSKAVSFAMPALSRGAIVEYRWSEFHDEDLLDRVRLPFAREYPIHRAVYRVKALPLKNKKLQILPFGHGFAALQEEGDYYVISASDIQAVREEPHSPPRWKNMPWVLIHYYTPGPGKTAEEYWKWVANGWAIEDEKATEPTAAIRAVARAATVASATLDEKLSALLREARARIRRTDVASSAAAGQKARDAAKHAGQAFERREGIDSDLLDVFVAMARAVDIDARPAYLPGRDGPPFAGRMMATALLAHRVAAIRDGAAWRFLDPANHLDPTGALRWNQEGQPALIPDRDSVITAVTPTSGPERNAWRRRGTFALTEDGTLEGDVEIVGDGNVGFERKQAGEALSQDERVNQLRKEIAARLPLADVTQVSIEHVTDAEGDYRARCHLRVPGYAKRSGSALSLQPSVFERNRPVEFSAASRANPIWYDYPWSERDQITISLPVGYTLAPPAESGPAPITLPGVARLSVKLTSGSSDSQLQFSRDFVFGEGRQITFKPATYDAIKRFFQAVQENGEYSVTIAPRKEPGGPVGGSDPARQRR